MTFIMIILLFHFHRPVSRFFFRLTIVFGALFSLMQKVLPDTSSDRTDFQKRYAVFPMLLYFIRQASLFRFTA